MYRISAALIAISVTILIPLSSNGGTVLMMEPGMSAPLGATHREFFNELGLVLQRDELYRRNDEGGAFFSSSTEEKIVAAGMFCDEGVSMSVLWIDAQEDGIHQLGVVVDTSNGKVARVVDFDMPMPLSEAAIVAGELIEHGRAFARTTTAKEDGWTVMRKDAQTSSTEENSENESERESPPTRVLDTERPWDPPDTYIKISLIEPRSRFMGGLSLEFLRGVSSHIGPGLWIGQTLYGTFGLTDELFISAMMTGVGGAIPNEGTLIVRGFRLIPRIRIAYVIGFDYFELVLAVNGGPIWSKLWIADTGVKEQTNTYWDGMTQTEILMRFHTDSRIVFHIGPIMTFEFTERRFIVPAEDGEAETLEIYRPARLSLGGKIGFAVFI